MAGEVSITTIIVVGSSGFLGGALMNALAKNGVTAVGLARERPFATMDGTPASELREADGIAFLAGSITPATAEQDPAAVTSELQLFDSFIACLHNLERRPVVIMPSSGGTVYDPSGTPPFVETSPTGPTSAYGKAKLAMEQRLLTVGDEVARVASVRISNAYGPGHRLGRGQGVTGHWLAAAARGEPLRVFGDLSATRDYVYIDDVGDAMLRLLVKGQDAEVPRVVNIGSGVPTSLGELVEAVSHVVGGAEVVREPGRGFDGSDSWLDVGLAERAIGWVPRVPLAEGLLRTWNHVRAGRSSSTPHA